MPIKKKLIKNYMKKALKEKGKFCPNRGITK